MSERTFEERLAQRLTAHGDRGIRSFDALAIAETTISSRRRWRPILPPFWRGPDSRSLRLVLTSGLLLVLLLTATFALGGGSPDRLPPPRSGLFVWTAGTGTFIGQDGERATRPARSPRGNDCPVLVGGTGIVAQGGFGELRLTDLTGGAAARSIDTSYAGGERWSPDRRRVALIRFDGSITIVAADGPGLGEVTVDTPGVVEAAWADDGRHLAVARQVDGTESLAIDLLDVSAEPVETLHMFTLDGVTPEARLLPSPDGSSIFITVFVDQAADEPRADPAPAMRGYVADPTTGGLVPLDSGVAPVAWDPDGSRMLAQLGDRLVFVGPNGQVVDAAIPFTGGRIDSATWSPDGRWLALVSDGELVTIDPGSKDVARITLDRPSYQWAPDGSSLWVASAGKDTDGLAVVLLQQYGPDLIPLGEPLSVPWRQTDPICFSLSDVQVGPDGTIAVTP